VSRVVIMGLGRFGGGAAAARYYAERGHSVLVTDGKTEAQLAESIASLQDLTLEFRLGGHEESDFTGADIIVVNPAIPFDHPLVRQAPSTEIRTEIGITIQNLPGPVIAITGTNGKSTTATLCASMLEQSGVPFVLGGNIGRPLLNECAHLAPGTVAILELSSFQLQWLEHDDLAPAVAIVTNVTGDHLDRHPTFEHYANAKARLARAVPPEGKLILPRHDPVAASFEQFARAPVTWFGPDEVPPVDLSRLGLVGAHNRGNAAAAAHAALAVGATSEGCAAGAEKCVALPHRLELVGDRDGVLCVNDSVCTTPVATLAAVRSFDRPVVLLIGGKHKGLDLAPLIVAASEARAVVAYGDVMSQLAGAIPRAHLERHFDAAVRCGLDLARAGDVLLLSPAFASYDEFAGFDVRGDRFRELLEISGALRT
jgi:UDP-N-acetylmuramoylalanine--D-glutamate ligase